MQFNVIKKVAEPLRVIWSVRFCLIITLERFTNDCLTCSFFEARSEFLQYILCCIFPWCTLSFKPNSLLWAELYCYHCFGLRQYHLWKMLTQVQGKDLSCIIISTLHKMYSVLTNDKLSMNTKFEWQKLNGMIFWAPF